MIDARQLIKWVCLLLSGFLIYATLLKPGIEAYRIHSTLVSLAAKSTGMTFAEGREMVKSDLKAKFPTIFDATNFSLSVERDAQKLAFSVIYSRDRKVTEMAKIVNEYRLASNQSFAESLDTK